MLNTYNFIKCEICNAVAAESEMVSTPWHNHVHRQCKQFWLFAEDLKVEQCGYCQGGTDPEVMCDTCWNKINDLTCVLINCTSCQHMHQVSVPTEGYLQWKEGELIQVALKDMSDIEREMLIMNMCENCVNELYSSFSEDEE